MIPVVLLLLAAPDAGHPAKVAPEPSITVLFSGDVTLGFHYEEWVDQLIAKGTAKDAALGWGFDKVKARTTKADLFVANLECPFTARGEKIPKNFNFRARPELVAALAAGGVDVVSLANNHLMDYGPDGLADTVETLRSAGITAFGAGQTLEQARQGAVVTRNGVTIAFLGYFFLGDRNIEPKEVIAAGEAPGVAGHFSSVEEVTEMLKADIATAKTRAQVVIPFFHWGREGRTQPEPYQVALAHAAIDSGAAAVIGSHPHVLQGMEQYQGAPIVYSLGNFVFGGNWDPKDKRTALVELTVTPRGVKAMAVLPAVSDHFPEAPAQPELLEGDAGQAVLDHLRTISVPLGAVPLGLRQGKPLDQQVAHGADAGR